MGTSRSVNQFDFEKYKICVICSTQNQMVNYIPLKMREFSFETIYNITIDGSSYFKNSVWDKNLEESLGKQFKSIKLQQGDTHSVSKILENKELDALKDLDDKIFWNITGGQRTILLSIMKIIKNSKRRQDDVICYLEGNNNKMYISDINHQQSNAIDYSSNSFDLDIKKALQLGGFKISEVESDENHLEAHTIEAFFVQYKDTSNKLRDLMIKTNTAMTQEQALEELKKLSCKNKKEIEKVLTWGYEKNSSTPFGYILEEMAYHLIKKDTNVAELKTNVRLYTKGVSGQLDEFDIALLTKNGKFIIFECKSGGMGGDVAKSTKYSTYAVSGVYGLPILITPLLESEAKIENIDKLGKDYKYIKEAKGSAERANLEVWGIDKIKENLEKYIKI